MANFTPDDASGLRLAIQNATIGSTVLLTTGQTYSSITTLAKFTCYTPLTRTSNYTIDGNGGSGRTTVIENTSIYQQNIDGNLPPSAGVKNLTLNYTTGNTAILAATKGSYIIDNIKIAGTHSGWAGNGGVYMSLIGQVRSDTSGYITANLTLNNSAVDFTGNNQSSTASFLQSWNNNGMVTLTNNNFKEAGYSRGTFHFASMFTDGVAATASTGLYTVTGNTFTGDGTAKVRGNRIETVNATIRGNTFETGSYLDLYGELSGLNIDSTNQFKTVLGGTGIRFNKNSSASGTNPNGATLSNPNSASISGNTFTGYGLAYTNIDSANNSIIQIAAANTYSFGALGPFSLSKGRVGGQGNDSITATPNEDWISGDAGADTIVGGLSTDVIIGGSGNDTITTGTTTPGSSEADLILYYETTEGGDTITDFEATGATADKLGFRAAAFGNLGTGGLNAANFSTTGATTTVPTFYYNQSNGVLIYDADGLNTGNAGTTIATLSNLPTLANTNIVLF